MAAVEADRVLASIVIVSAISPIEGADKIELASINGWRCVVKKEEFHVGDIAVYICIDSIPDFTDPNFQFLIAHKVKRIKTMKIRGEISQGLLGSLKWLSDRGHTIDELKEGDNVTSQMGVTKYVQTDELAQYDILNEDGLSFPFPSHLVPKTDEDRIQNNPKYLTKLAGFNIINTRKEDGCSGTFVCVNDKDNVGSKKFMVCSRNNVILKGNTNGPNYFFIENKLKLGTKLLEYCNANSRELAIQGEIVGPKINGNRLLLSEYFFRVFNIYDITKKKYLFSDEISVICTALGLDQVPVIYKGLANDMILKVNGSDGTFSDKTFGELITLPNGKREIIDALLKMADNQEYSPGNHAEGMVIKIDDPLAIERISFKVISNEFLLAKDGNNIDKKKYKKEKVEEVIL
jgi:RNA ligase (TIGR02306 family)